MVISIGERIMSSDLTLAKWYVIKADQSLLRGIEFDLGLLAFRNIAKSKKCYYTGLPLCRDTLTIDRVDNTLGYVRGNVVACHKAFNQLKAVVENPVNKLTQHNVTKAFNKWGKI